MLIQYCDHELYNHHDNDGDDVDDDDDADDVDDDDIDDDDNGDEGSCLPAIQRLAFLIILIIMTIMKILVMIILMMIMPNCQEYMCSNVQNLKLRNGNDWKIWWKFCWNLTASYGVSLFIFVFQNFVKFVFV